MAKKSTLSVLGSVSVNQCHWICRGGSRISRWGMSTLLGAQMSDADVFWQKCMRKQKNCSGRSRISHSGHRPVTQALFGKNVCEYKRIGSHREHASGMPPRSANELGPIGGGCPLDPPMDKSTLSVGDQHESGIWYGTGRSRWACLAHAPPWDPILLFLHTFLAKSARVGGPRPPPPQRVHAPPTGNPGSATVWHGKAVVYHTCNVYFSG